MCLEGQISKESARRSLARGEAPSGDLIPWTVAQQFQESDFASLSGARIVRVAVHPEMQHMGYGSRAIEQLIHYYQGDMDGGAKPKRPKSSTNTNASRDGNGGEGGGLLSEELHPRAELPPLLLTLAQRPAERLHWIGASFGLTHPLFRFWHRLGFKPIYVRQTVNETTGEHTSILIRALDESGALDEPAGAGPKATRTRWASEYHSDFRRRLAALLGQSMRPMAVDLALSLLDPELQPAEPCAPTSEELGYLLGPYDLRRLQSYANNLVDHHLVLDLVPLLASLRFTGKLRTPLSHVQAAILLGLGLQHKSVDALASELGLPGSQLLALFNKAIRRILAAIRQVEEASEGATLPLQEDVDAAGSAFKPMSERLSDELDAGAKESLEAMRREQARKQAAWLSEVEGGSELARYAVKGSDADWAAALGSAGAAPGHVSLRASADGADAKSPKDKKEDKKAKRKDGDGGKSPKRRKS